MSFRFILYLLATLTKTLALIDASVRENQSGGLAHEVRTERRRKVSTLIGAVFQAKPEFVPVCIRLKVALQYERVARKYIQDVTKARVVEQGNWLIF